MYGDALRSPTATAMGGLPTGTTSKAKPSPKVHPAPQPPIWPHSAMPNRVKKLSWGDDKVKPKLTCKYLKTYHLLFQTDSDSTENINNIEMPRKLTDNTNLTVYF